jgi:ribosomal protein S27E
VIRTGLNERVITALCEAVAAGRSMVLAAEIAGYTDRMVLKWLKQGRTDIEAGDVGTIFASLVRQLAGARDQMSRPLAEAARAQAINGSDNRAAIAALETFLPSHYGKKALELQQALEAAAQAVESAEAARAALVVRCNGCGTGTATDDRSTPPIYCAACGERFPSMESTPSSPTPTEGA